MMHRNLAGIERLLGERESAAAHLRAARGVLAAIGDRRGEGRVQGDLGSLCLELGELSAGETELLAALAIHQEVESRDTEAMVCGGLGQLATIRGDLVAAREHYTLAAALVEGRGHAWVRACWEGELGLAAMLSGDLDMARTSLSGALEAHSRIGFTHGHARWLHLLAELDLREGHFDAALQRAEAAVQTGASIPSVLADASLVLADVQLARGDLPAARAALDAARASPCPLRVPGIHATAGELALACNDRVGATVALVWARRRPDLAPQGTPVVLRIEQLERALGAGDML